MEPFKARQAPCQDRRKTTNGDLAIVPRQDAGVDRQQPHPLFARFSYTEGVVPDLMEVGNARADERLGLLTAHVVKNAPDNFNSRIVDAPHDRCNTWGNSSPFPNRCIPLGIVAAL